MVLPEWCLHPSNVSAATTAAAHASNLMAESWDEFWTQSNQSKLWHYKLGINEPLSIGTWGIWSLGDWGGKAGGLMLLWNQLQSHFTRNFYPAVISGMSEAGVDIGAEWQASFLQDTVAHLPLAVQPAAVLPATEQTPPGPSTAGYASVWR